MGRRTGTGTEREVGSRVRMLRQSSPSKGEEEEEKEEEEEESCPSLIA